MPRPKAVDAESDVWSFQKLCLGLRTVQADMGMTDYEFLYAMQCWVLSRLLEMSLDDCELHERSLQHIIRIKKSASS